MINVKTDEFKKEKLQRLSLESNTIDLIHNKLSDAMAARYECDIQLAATNGFICGLKLLEKVLFWMNMVNSEGERLSDEAIESSIQREIDRYLDNGFVVGSNK